jgi:hypothetical protein
MSPVNTVVFVLFTSFVSRMSTFPTLRPDQAYLYPDCLSMFSPPGASIQVAPSPPPLCRSVASFYPYFLPRSMARCLPSRVWNIWKRCHVLHSHVPLVALSPARKVSRASNCQNVEVMGVISQRHGRHAQVLQEPA